MKVFKKVKINLKSTATGNYKGDFKKSTLKRTKLPPISPNEELVMEEIVEEQLRREEDEYLNSVTVQKKRRIDIAVRKLSKEDLKREESSERKIKECGRKIGGADDWSE